VIAAFGENGYGGAQHIGAALYRAHPGCGRHHET
jgi:hypothetical protein